MLSSERQRQLLRYMRSRGAGDVNDLAETIGVSASTIRRDLREMDQQGLLTRVHGGASLPEAEVENAFTIRLGEHEGEKRRIGIAAADLVEDDTTILITGGTTTEAMIPFLSGRQGLTVVTNGLNIAQQLSRHNGITVVVLGGILRRGEMSLLGPLGEQTLEEFDVGQGFIGAYGIHSKLGLSGASVHEANTDRRLLNGLNNIVVMVDGSKFHQRGPVRLARVDQISILITDATAPADEVDALIESGVDTRVV